MYLKTEEQCKAKTQSTYFFLDAPTWSTTMEGVEMDLCNEGNCAIKCGLLCLQMKIQNSKYIRSRVVNEYSNNSLTNPNSNIRLKPGEYSNNFITENSQK